MSQSRLELKVGIFVVACLAVLGGLLIEFSRGPTLFRHTYNLNLVARNAGGLRPAAAVLLSGVQVGTVSEINLAPSDTNVNITLRIFSEYIIKSDARFAIEQSGFLGDQYVAVYPDSNAGAPLTPGASIPVEDPFNLQEVARAASGFITHIDAAATNLNAAINDVRRDVLNQQTLTNFAYTVTMLQKVTQDAASAVDSLNALITSNGAAVGGAVSNLVTFSGQLDGLASSAQGILDSNRPQITMAISNLQISTSELTNLLGQAENGNGLAGAVLKNQQMAEDIATLASNLSVASGNLRSNGLWRFLWKPKTPDPANGGKK